MSEHQATSEEKERADGLKNKGNELLREKKFSEALACYSKAIALDNRNAVYFYNRAVAHGNLNQQRLAIEDCKEALAINPSYHKAYGRMGLAYTALEDHWEAAECYREALEIHPDDQEYMTKLEEGEQTLQDVAASSGLNFGPTEEKPDFSRLLRIPSVKEKSKELMEDNDLWNIMADIMGGAPTGRKDRMDRLMNVGGELASLMEQGNPELVKQLRLYMSQNFPSQ